MAKPRDHIAEQMEEEFSVVSVEAFMPHYLPFEPAEDDVKQMDKSLAKMEILVEVDGNPRFHEVLVPPCKIDGTETPSYRLLDDVSRAIASVPVEGRKRNRFSFRVCPDTVIKSQIAGSDNKVDGCFTSEHPESKTLDTSHLACILEYGLNSTQVAENNKQALSASVQIMNDDVCRMFTYGITIIEDCVTLWYHSRSHSMISEPFSFVENPRLLIKVFMSFLFATEEELGYDPIVMRDAKGDYIYRIPSTEQGQQRDRFFRTTASIAEYRSNNITGRMARVWKVVECNPSGAVLSPSEPSRVLKDVWLEDSALTESQIQSQIFEDIKKFFRDKQDARYLAFERLRPSISDLERNDRYRKYFIQIVADYDGRRTKPRLPNSQRKRRLFSTVEPLALPTTSNRGGSGTPCPTESKITFDEGPREFAPRKQYRVIFGEVCEAVGDLGTAGEVADVLSQAIVALRLMYCAGWVHRDISSGNILAHRRSSSSPWQVKLSDLVYARQFSDSDRNVGDDPKTGTPYFMPHEILSSRYIAPRSVTEKEPELGDDDFRDGGAPQPPEPPPVYNFQHDLESIWWIFVWTITCRVSHEPSIAFGRTIFQNLMEPPLARLRFLEDTITQRFMGCLLSPLQQLAGPLEVLRSFMVVAYTYRRKANGLSSYVKAHQGFVIFFEKVKQSQATWGDTLLVTHHRPVASMASVPSAADIAKPTRLKRPRDDDAYEPDAEAQRPKSRRSKKASGKT
ncbi:hypothetical protein CCMSSC00406_0010224 [Pleurotus cornucopiae]|uniref:Uncharacterized protein n=1 Tax=Pleurotus cornucopiae TaxID=5321 RepID=A0ACB7IIY7_PLECO|nr:hypothetical protein CCMSSC00406_0010224 [Pleurotus cornucopiae]